MKFSLGRYRWECWPSKYTKTKMLPTLTFHTYNRSISLQVLILNFSHSEDTSSQGGCHGSSRMAGVCSTEQRWWAENLESGRGNITSKVWDEKEPKMHQNPMRRWWQSPLRTMRWHKLKQIQTCNDKPMMHLLISIVNSFINTNYVRHFS